MATEGAYTKRLAEFCATARLEDFPKPVQERAKYVILDGLGCGLFGAGLPWSRIQTRTVAALSPGGISTVWGTDLRLPPDHAALLNGSFVQGFELDDIHITGGLHSCAAILPAVLACADLAGPVSGADLLTAIMAGFEVGPRLGMCMGGGRLVLRGWHGGAVISTFPAAAAAGRVLGLTPEQMAHAFGIAGTQSAGLMAAQFSSMVKRMHHGRSSQSGLYAALLAKDGYTGIENIFEERYGGWCTTFSATLDRFDLNKLIDGLGSRFEVEQLKIKPYSCNGSIHPSLDAIRTIRDRRPFSSAEVSRVVVRCTEATMEHVGWKYEPSSMTTAQMNLSFGVATMLEFGEVFIDQYTEESIRSPRLLELARKVSVVHEPAFDTLGERHYTELTVEFLDGTRETETVPRDLGLTARPNPHEKIAAKYDVMARKALSIEQADALKEQVLNLEELDDARKLSDLLRGSVSLQSA